MSRLCINHESHFAKDSEEMEEAARFNDVVIFFTCRGSAWINFSKEVGVEFRFAEPKPW
jgi:hypothetical protein